MAATHFTPVVQYVGKNLFSATCPEYPDCHGVADSADAACEALERAIEEEIRKRSSQASLQPNESEPR
jgi:predicted RNase H-like HicB family nuclease